MARVKDPIAKRRKISATAAVAGSDGSDGAAAAFIPTVQGDDILTVQCLDGFMLVDNRRLAAMTSSSDDIPRVLFHLLQIRTGGFKAETSGSVDLRCYEIKRKHLSNIIVFIRTDVLPSYPEKVEEMQQVFERLGGWDRFDSAYLKYQKEQKLKDVLSMENPQIPSQDTLGLYFWHEPHTKLCGTWDSRYLWSHTSEYVDSQTHGRKYWKRKRRDGNDGNFEIKYRQFIGLKNEVVGA